MNETANYKLQKPETSDYVSVDVINTNMEILDKNLKNVSDKAEKAVTVRNIALKAADWSDSYPYTQAVAVDGITVDSNLKVIGVYVPDGSTADQVKARNKAAGFLMSNEDATGDGTVTFKAYKKPGVDFTVIVEGG